ncbi:MAG: PLDc N-terminal domain-containing protein, partial [Oscillospiraceae bacterium]
MKKFFTIVFSRVVLIALLLVFQAASLILMLLFFSDMFAQFYAVCVLLTSVVILYIINSKSNPAYKIAWLIPIVLLPIFGGLMYICFGNNHMPLRKRKSMSMIRSRFDSAINYFPSAANELKEASADAYLQSRYLENCARAPVYNRTATTFLPLGEVKFECMLAELEKAERFIFLEYFIIGTGKMWSAVLEILERKAAAGVEVRVMYDDFGCLFTIPGNFRRQLESKGIKCCVFNKFIPVLSARFNYRDHRKICVIDGCVGFTGGINIADEYINAYEKHGHWKDCSVMLRGDAVWSLTVMFLSVWDFVRNVDEDFTLFAPLPAQVDTFVSDGYVQPYTDTPLDDEPVGENAYMNMISRAKKYVYISTPYLIIDNEM